ncbi:MAG: BlaI/MecI/CopY family transcriptional regulator [Actinobacteria bacterium]|nr:BlaI/MecI/CopY family transcriptional regulator [Actinomycetota bacterium]MBI3688528.1 BlaI/MecI/CopY family transcriptional regulator [Actinomycetota bacterium]
MADGEQRRGYGDLAQAILELVGRAGRPVSPAYVRDALGAELAYTTVTTVMTRLHDRGLLARQRSGRAFVYTAVGDPAQVTARRMHRLLDVDDDRAGVLARFVGGLNPTDEQLLRSLLAELDDEDASPGDERR